MDFLNPRKKRAHRIRLMIGYGLMAIALIISTLIVVFFTYGYDIDRQTGSIIQNGLITINGRPESADIYVNGVNKGRTNNSFVLPAGSYDIELKRDGYLSWYHHVDLEGGSIEQLTYPLLFPKDLITTKVTDLSHRPAFVSQSPDRRWLVLASSDKIGNFQLFDLNASQLSGTNIGLPADTFTATGSKHKFSEIEWSSDNTHLFLKHTWSAGIEFVMLNRNRLADSFSVSKLFPSQTISQATLRDKRADQFYFWNSSKKTLVRVSRGNPGVTSIANNVISFKAYQSNSLIYVSPSPTIKNEVNVHLWDNERDFVLRTLPKADRYLIGISSFGGHMYAAAGNPVDGKTYIYQDPLKDLTRIPSLTPQAFRVLVVPKSTNLSLSSSGRFIAVQGGSNFAVYDAENARQFRYDTKLTLLNGQKATWLDEHHLALVSRGKAVVFDFDGLNLQPLSAASPNYVPVFGQDDKTLLTVVDTKNPTAVLNRTELVVLSPDNSRPGND
jgi:hypothetical protein